MYLRQGQFSGKQFSGIIDDQIVKLEAQIKAQVGEFLQFPSKLLPFTRSPDPQVATDATKLLARNNALEIRLNKTLDLIDELKKQDLGISTAIAYSSEINESRKFLSDFKDHKNKVNRFLKTGGSAGSAGEQNNLYLLIGAAGALGLTSFLAKKLWKG